MEKLEKISRKYFILIILILSVPAVWALFVPGFYGASDDLHIAWLNQFHKALMMGQVPPRFVPDLSYGFGYPLFNFVFPLPFYIAEIFHLLGFSLVDSIKALLFLTIPLSGFFMYYLLREYTDKFLSLMGAVLYIYTPYRSVDIYVRGAIGEAVSFVILPSILLSIIKISKSKNLRWVGIGAISLASLVLSHNIAALMFFPFAGLFFLLQTIFLSAKKVVLKFSLMVFLALLISIYFWLPAIADSSLMKYDTVFNFADHFPTIVQLFTPYWGYGASVPGPNDGISFFLGLTNIAVFLIGLVFLFFFWRKIEKGKKIILIWAMICVVFSIFLMNHRSSPIWDNLPLLSYFQFPWRFLILTTFTIPIFIIIFERLMINKLILIVIIMITIITTGSFFKPEDFLGRRDEYFLNRYIPFPEASNEYKKTQEEYLRLPKNTQYRPDRNYPRATSDDKSIKSIINVNDLDAVLEVDSDKGTVINYNKYLFPGWIVEIDGNVVDIFPNSPFGQISFSVPSGPHLVKVSFKETLFKIILNAISLTSFLVSLWLAKLWIRSKKIGPFFQV